MDHSAISKNAGKTSQLITGCILMRLSVANKFCLYFPHITDRLEGGAYGENILG